MGCSGLRCTNQAALIHSTWLVHFLLWQAAKPSGDKCTPLVGKCYNLIGALETSAPLVGECYKLVGALETSAPPNNVI